MILGTVFHNTMWYRKTVRVGIV